MSKVKKEVEAKIETPVVGNESAPLDAAISEFYLCGLVPTAKGYIPAIMTLAPSGELLGYEYRGTAELYPQFASKKLGMICKQLMQKVLKNTKSVEMKIGK